MCRSLAIYGGAEGCTKLELLKWLVGVEVTREGAWDLACFA